MIVTTLSEIPMVVNNTLVSEYDHDDGRNDDNDY
jgi:hypothetical protein